MPLLLTCKSLPKLLIWGGGGAGDVNDNPHIHPMDDKQ